MSLVSDPNLIADIKSALATAISSALKYPPHGADLYEIYIWSLVVDAAKKEGATIDYVDVNGKRVVSQFLFRTTPGNLSSKVHPYTHAVLQFKGRAVLEAHVGIFVSGKSRVKHECDVAVIYATEAQRCRRHNLHPRFGRIVLASECKFYVQSTMGVELARSYLGLTSEIGQTDRYFIGVSESATVERLLERHQKQWETGVFPSDTKQRSDRLRSTFEKTFRNFKLRTGY